ncbi:TolB-like translocation protein [Conexibacter woesei]|uniref:WD40 domain protein beta Propeller n=1 Tax=Conexibacter woesei (strain DSM 14684 / CCUG 47730 / CIP 108061 / JCM 11494 / NBRC 100937 / ID131577) TaxID=469383 RepID=D3FB92_CONWI|nr:hypothetical protein [Conexibacter woesei]ADB53284.1 hypothetical protein Cwoe_4872 [Conexibacter woesei DSM 14684]
MVKRSDVLASALRRVGYMGVCVVLFCLASPPHAAVADLQHGRQLELVPTDTNQTGVANVLYSDDGDRLFYDMVGGNDLATNGALPSFLATRGDDGWTSRGLLPPRAEQHGSVYFFTGATTDLARFTYAVTNGVFPQPPPPTSLVRLGADRTQELLVRWPGGLGYQQQYAVQPLTSDDLAHVVALSGTSLDPRDPGSEVTPQLYDFGAGIPRLLSVLPDDSASACGAAIGAGSTRVTAGQHWISRDGSYVHFLGRSSCGDPFNLFVRNAGQTRLVSGPPVAGADHGATFVQATPDGRTVVFATRTQLVLADQNDGLDVYRSAGGPADCLTCGIAGAEIQRAIASEDGTRVYFTSPALLVPGRGSPDSPLNIYTLTGDGPLRYVAGSSGRGDLTGVPSAGDTLTADGSVYLFASGQQPGGPDVGGCRDPFGAARPCTQLYRYEAGSGAVTCISCPPAGSPAHDVPTSLSGSGLQVDRTSPMSADGRIVFFRTADPLVPEDVNRDLDVYEWNDGAVSLITDGRTSFPASITGHVVIGTTASGRDAFFTSYAPLVPGLTEAGTLQLYDARIGGRAARPPAPPREPCDGDGCQGAPASPPQALAIGSLGGTGRGNVEPGARRAGRLVVRRPRPFAGATGVVRVRVDGGGQVAASGAGVRPVTAFVRRAGTHALRIALHARSRARLRARGTVRITLRIVFRPTGRAPSRTAVVLTFTADRARKGR